MNLQKYVVPAVVAVITTACTSIATHGVQAATILGTGTGALLQNDLTDPEGDGTDAGLNYNATFFANKEPGFGGGEFAFNVFDNKVGGGNDKWCCNPASVASPTLVGADFGTTQYVLTGFTLASQDAGPGRRPDLWAIQGSNDTTNGTDGTWTDIFADIVGGGTTPFTANDQVVSFVSGADFAAPLAYSKFRFIATADTGGGGLQLAEIEFFGTEFVAPVPEPTSIAIWTLIGLGLSGFGWWRLRRKK